jgi:hypothetical protein
VTNDIGTDCVLELSATNGKATAYPVDITVNLPSTIEIEKISGPHVLADADDEIVYKYNVMHPSGNVT